MQAPESACGTGISTGTGTGVVVLSCHGPSLIPPLSCMGPGLTTQLGTQRGRQCCSKPCLPPNKDSHSTVAARGRNPPERKPSGYPQHTLTSATHHANTALHCHGRSLLSLTIYPVTVWPSRGSSQHTLLPAMHSDPPDKSGLWFHTYRAQRSQCTHSLQAVHLRLRSPVQHEGLQRTLQGLPPLQFFVTGTPMKCCHSGAKAKWDRCWMRVFQQCPVPGFTARAVTQLTTTQQTHAPPAGSSVPGTRTRHGPFPPGVASLPAMFALHFGTEETADGTASPLSVTQLAAPSAVLVSPRNTPAQRS